MTLQRYRLLPLVSINFAALLACQDAREQGAEFGELTTGPKNDGTASDTSTVTLSSTGSDDSTGTQSMSSPNGVDSSDAMPAPTFDVGTMPDVAAIDAGCTSVDFLFVIDNSTSMWVVQQNLINNFPNFIAGIQSTLDNVETYQVGVVTTDSYFGNAPFCSTSIGALVTRTDDGLGTEAVCGPFAEGRNYMTEADDLAVTFSCAANVGVYGDAVERPMDAVTAVMSKILDGAGGCNEGFLRDDALLVVIVISDEWDGPDDPEGGGSAGGPQDWYDAVIAAKLGIPENAVVGVLVNDADGPCPPVNDFSDGKNIADFATLFGANGFVGGICEPDYGPLFEQAIGVIASACDNFIPPAG